MLDHRNLEEESDPRVLDCEIVTVMPVAVTSLKVDDEKGILFIGSIEGVFEYRDGALYDPADQKVYRN